MTDLDNRIEELRKQKLIIEEELSLLEKKKEKREKKKEEKEDEKKLLSLKKTQKQRARSKNNRKDYLCNFCKTCGKMDDDRFPFKCWVCGERCSVDWQWDYKKGIIVGTRGVIESGRGIDIRCVDYAKIIVPNIELCQSEPFSVAQCACLN